MRTCLDDEDVNGLAYRVDIHSFVGSGSNYTHFTLSLVPIPLHIRLTRCMISLPVFSFFFFLFFFHFLLSSTYPWLTILLNDSTTIHTYFPFVFCLIKASERQLRLSDSESLQGKQSFKASKILAMKPRGFDNSMRLSEGLTIHFFAMLRWLSLT